MPKDVLDIAQATIPGEPLNIVGPFQDVYVLRYVERSSHLAVKFFKMEGDFRSVIERGKSYCEQMRYRFLRVEPFLSNLQDDINKTSF